MPQQVLWQTQMIMMIFTAFSIVLLFAVIATIRDRVKLATLFRRLYWSYRTKKVKRVLENWTNKHEDISTEDVECQRLIRRLLVAYSKIPEGKAKQGLARDFGINTLERFVTITENHAVSIGRTVNNILNGGVHHGDKIRSSMNHGTIPRGAR